MSRFRLTTARDFTMRLDRIADDLQADGREDLALVVDQCSDHLEGRQAGIFDFVKNLYEKVFPNKNVEFNFDFNKKIDSKSAEVLKEKFDALKEKVNPLLGSMGFTVDKEEFPEGSPALGIKFQNDSYDGYFGVAIVDKPDESKPSTSLYKSGFNFVYLCEMNSKKPSQVVLESIRKTADQVISEFKKSAKKILEGVSPSDVKESLKNALKLIDKEIKPFIKDFVGNEIKSFENDLNGFMEYTWGENELQIALDISHGELNKGYFDFSVDNKKFKAVGWKGIKDLKTKLEAFFRVNVKK
jgi:hypothetical protein